MHPVKPSCFLGLVGVARADITPPVGIYNRCWGAADSDFATDVHREIMLTVFCFRQPPGDPLFLVNMELPALGADEWTLFLDLIAETAGIQEAPQNIILNLAHNHSTAPIQALSPEILDDPTLLDAYRQRVANLLKTAVQSALNQLQPAQITFAMGRCDLARNRDLQLTQGGPFFCGFNPDGSADDALLVARITAADGHTLGTFINYACHPTSLAWENTTISPDFIGAMRALVEHETGAPCCLLQGASGELSPRLCHQSDLEEADKQGRQLGYAALSCLEGMLAHNHQLNFGGTIASGADLAYWRLGPLKPELSMKTLQATCLPLSLYLKHDLPPLEVLETSLQTTDDRVQRERYRRAIAIRRHVGVSPVTLHLWRWQLGTLTLFAAPFELYSQIQVRLRAAFPKRSIAWLNLSNGSFSYLVPQELYGEKLYQKEIALFSEGSFELLFQQALLSL